MRLPFPESILRQHSATLGKTGAGKSSALRLIVEHLLDARKRVAVIDPKGDWWGLKTSADGKSAGYPVIAFGSFKEPRATDVPINEHSGRHVAELIATGNRPAVIGFRGWMPSQLTRFWLDFAPTLFNTNEGELHVAIDEIQNFAPKGKIMDPDAGKCLHWTNRILSEGRGLGLTFLIASQRPQKVHNDTLDNCETLIAMRVAHPRSREALADWMDGNGDPAKAKDVLQTLAQLKRGEAWIWSPENDFGPKRVTFPMFSTFDSFAPPQLQKKVSGAGWSTVDLEQVKTKLASVIAEQKANDPKELKAEVARLKTELRKLEASNQHVATNAPSKEQIDRASAAAVRTAIAPLTNQLADLKRKAAHVARQMAPIFTGLANVSKFLEDMTGTVAPAIALPAPTHEPPAARPQIVPRPAPAVISEPDPDADRTISPGMRKILAAAVQFQGIDLNELTTMTSYKATSRNEYVARLIRAGFAEKRSDRKVYPTPAGLEALGRDYKALPTGRALFEWWRNRLPDGELKLLRYLVENAAGAEVDKQTLQAAVGYRQSSTNEYIGRLARRRLIVKGSGTIKASESLFG